MSLLDKYDLAVRANDIQNDVAQRRIVGYLDEILLKINKPKPWYAKFYAQKIQGLYLMGPVGAGKTYLMDLFYANINSPNKARFHFHHFMQQVDKQLRQLQGCKNPVSILVKQLAQQVEVLCLDEFLVEDVAYAMILTELLTELFKRGVVLIITTNTEVDSLYKNGVGREKFLPAIAAIKKNCKIITIFADHDYRTGRTETLQTYYYPLNNKTAKQISEQFTLLTQPKAETNNISIFSKLIAREDSEYNVDDSPKLVNNVGLLTSNAIEILNRPITFVKLQKNIIWFDFKNICDVPRCKLDYLEIANKFDTIFITNIPVLSSQSSVQTILFMHFIDVAYDRGMRLFLSAAVSADKLYVDGELLVPFARTVSRLQEMQSMDYLRRHKYLNIDNLRVLF